MPNPYSIGGNYTKKVNPYSVGGNYTDTKKKDEIKEKDKEKDKKVNPNPFDKKLEPNKYQIYQDNEKHKDNLLLELDKLYYEYDKDDKFVKAKYYLENADKLGITNPEETFKTGMFTDSPSDAGEEFIKKYDKETYENMKYNYNQLQEVLKDYDSGNKNGISNQGIQIYNERVKMRNNLLSDTNKSTSERDNKQPDTNHQKEDKTSSEGINRVQTGISIGENKVNNSKTFNPLTNPNDEEVSILEGNYNAKDNQIKNSIEPPEDNDVVLEPEPDEEAESTYVPDVDSLRYQDKFDIIGKNTAKSESTAVDTGVKEEVLYHEDNKRVLKTKREEEFKLLEPFNQLVMDNLVYNNDTGRLQMKEGVKINDVYRQLDSLRNEVLYKMGWDPSDYNFFQREAINTTDDWIVDDYDGTLRYASEEFQMQSPGMGSGVRKHLGAIGDMFNDKDIPENVKKIIAEINGLQQIVKNKKWEEFASQSDLNPYTPDIDEILEKKAKGEDSIFSWDNVVESAKAGLYNAYATTFNMATVQGTKSGSERLRDEQELLANYYVEVTNMNYEPPPAEVQDMIVEIGLKNIKERYRKADGTTIEDATAIAEYDEIINAMRMNPEIYKKNIEQMNQLQQEIEEFLIKSHEVGITSSRSNEMFDALSSEAMKLISFSEQVGSMAVQLATTYPLGYSMAGMVGKGFMRGGNLIKNVPKVQKILNANGGIAKMYNRLGKGLSFTNSVLNPSYGYGNRVLWSSKDYMPNMLHSAAGMGAGAAIGKTLQHDYNDTYYDILKEGKNYALFGFFGGGLSNLYNRIGANKLARVIGTSNKYSQNGILTNAGKAKIAKNYLLANTVGDFVGSPLSTVWEEIVTGEAGGIDKLKWEDYMFEGLFDIILGIREMPGTASRAFGLGQDIKRSDIYGEKITINSNYMSKIPIEVNDTGGMRAENPNAYTNRYTAPYENIENIVEDYKISNKEKFNKEDIRVKDILDATDSKILSKNEKELLRNNFGDIKINAFNNELKTQVAKYDEKTGEISLANNGRLYNRIDEESITNDDIIDAITHELAHSQTVEELKNNPNGELAKEIKGIADNFKKRYKDDKSFRKRVNKDESAKELADALNLFDREVDVLELTAILSQKDSPLHKHLDIKPSKMAKLMGKKDKHRTEFFYNIFAKPVEHKEPKDIKITKPTTDQNINKQKETVSDVNVESDIKNQNDVFLDNIALPNHIIDKKLSNKNKSKRLASSNEDNIRINPVENVQEFYDYFEGKVEGETSNQKKEVLNRLADKGYPLEKIKKILNDVQSINTFLLLYEHSHIVNKDIAVYWKNGKNLLTEDKIQIETRATINALDSIEDAKREEDEFAGLDPKDFEDDYDDTIDADKLDDEEHFANADYFNRKGIKTNIQGAKEITDALKRFRNKHNDIEDVANATKPFSLLMRDYLIDNPDKDLNAKNFIEYLNTKTEDAQPKEIELTKQQQIILNDINDKVLEERNKRKYHFDHKSDKIEIDMQNLISTLNYSNKEKMYKALTNEGIRINSPLKVIRDALQNKLNDRIKYGNIELSDNELKTHKQTILTAALSYKNLTPYRSITVNMENDKIKGIKSYGREFKNKDKKDLPSKIDNIPVFYSAMQNTVNRLVTNGQNANAPVHTDANNIINELMDPSNISEVSIIIDNDGNEIELNNRFKDENSIPLINELMKNGYYLLPKERGGIALYSPTLFQIAQNDPNKLSTIKKSLYNTLVHAALNSDFAKYNTDLFKNKRLKELYDDMGSIIDFEHIVKNNYKPDRISNFGLVGPEKREGIKEKAKKIASVPADKELITNWAINTAKTLMTDFNSNGETLTNNISIGSLVSGYVSSAIMPGMENYFFKKKDDKVFFKKMWTKYINMMTNDTPMRIQSINDFEALFPEYTTNGKIDDKKLRKLIYDPKNNTIKKRVLVIPHSLFEGDKMYENLNEFSHDGNSYVIDEQYIGIHRRMLADNDADVMVTKTHSFQTNKDGTLEQKTQHQYYNTQRFDDGTEDAGSLINRLKDVNASEIVFETAMKNKTPYRLKEVPTLIDNKNVILQVNNGGEIVAAKDENGEQIIGDDLKRFSEWTKEQVIAGNPPKHLFNEIDVTGKEGETMLSVAHVNDRLSNTVVPLFDIPAYSDINSDVWSGNNELYHKMRQIPDRIFEDKVEPLVKAISSFTNKQETDRQYLIKFIENFADKIKNSNANNEYVDTFGREEAIRRLERAVNNPDMLTNEINNLRMFGEGIFFNKKAIQPKRDIGGNILYNNDGSIIYKVNEKDLFNGTMAHKMLIQAVEDAAKVRVTTATFVGVPMMDKFAPEAAISLEGQLEYNRVFREEIENLKLDYNAGNITKEHFEEQKLVIDKIATQAKLSKQKDIGTKVNQLRETYYTNGSRLPDSKAPVIYISKKDYRILKQRDPSFTIGSKIFAKRTPIDSPASMLPVIVGGVLDGEGIMSIDKDIYAGFWGADFDKDAVQLILSDKYFDKVLYEEFWNHLSDMDLNQYNNKSASDYFNDIKSTYYGAGNKFTDKYALRAKESPKISPLLAHHNTSAFKSFIQQGSAINYRNTLAGIAETGKLQEVFPKIPYRMNSIKVGDKIHNVNEMDAIIGILSEAGVDYSDKNPFTPAELIEDHLYEFAKKEGIVARGKALGPMEKGPEERKLVLMELNQKLGTQKKGLFANKAKLKVPKDAPKYDTHMNRIYDRLASIMPDINSVGTEYLKEVNELKADILQNFDNDKRNSDIIFKKALNDIGLDNRYADLLSLSYLNNTLAIIQQARYKPTAQSNYSIKKEYNTDIFDKTNDKTEQKNIDIQNELALSDTEVHPKEKFMVATDLFGAMFINAPYLEINKLITDKMGGHTTTVPSLMHSNDNLKKRTLGSVYHHMAKVLGGREGGLPLMKQKIDGKNNVIYLEPNTGDIGHYVFSDNIKNYTRDNRAKILINVKDIFDSDGKINNKMNEEIMGTTLFKVIFPPESKANTIPLINQKQDYIIANKPTVLLNQNIINKNIISDIAQKSIEEHIRFANDLIPDNIDKSKVTNEIRGQYLYGKNKGVNASNKNVNRSLVFNLNHNLVNPFGLIQKVGIGATYGGKRVKTLLDNNEEHFALSSFFSNKFRERRNKRATLHNVASFLKGDELDYFMTTYGTNASDDKKDSQIQDKLLKQVNKHIKKLGLPIKETDKMYDDLLKAISPGAFNITEKKLLELEANNDNNNLIEMRAIRPVILYEIAKTLDNMSKDAKYKKGWLSNLIQYRMFDSRIPRAVYESIAQDYTYFDPEVVISSNYVYNNGKPAQNTDIDRNKTSIKLKHITDPKSLENSEILSNPIKNDFTPMDLVDRELMIRNMSGLHSKAVIKYVQPLFLINHDKDVLSEKLYDMKKVMYSITSDFNKDIKFNSLRKALGGNFSETLDKLIKIETRYDGIEANPNSNTITLLTTNESFDIKDPIKLQKEISKVLADKYGIQNQRAMSEAMVYITFKAYQNTILNVMSSFRDKTSNILNNLVDPTLSMDAMKKDPKAHGIYGLLNKAIDNVNSYINEISNITPDNYYKLFRERLAKDKDIADIYDMTMDITQSESILSLEELYHEKKNAIVDKYGGLTDYNKMDNPDIIQVLHNPYVEGLMQENNDAGSIDDFDNKSKEYLYNLFGNIEQRRKNLNKQEEKLYSDDKIENKDKKAKEIEYRLNNLNKFEEQLKQKIEEYGGKEQLIDEILTDAKKYAIISAENGGVYYNILNKLHIPGYERDFVELNGQERKHYDGLAKDIIKSKLEQEVTPYKRVKVHYDKASERIYHTKEGIKTSNEIYEKVDINDIIEALSPNSHRNNFFEGSPGVLDEKANVILKNSQINIENAMRHDYKYYKSDNFVADAIMNDMLSMTSGSQYIYDKEYDPGLLADNSIKKGMPIDIITRNNKDDMFTESIQGRWGGIIEVTGNAMLESIIGDNDLKEATTEMVIIYDDVSNNGQLHLIPKNNIRNIQTGRTYSRALPDLVEKRRQKMYDKAFSEIRKELNNIEFKSNEYKVRNIIGGMTIKDGKAFKPKIGKTIVHSNTVKNNIQDNLISSIYDVKIDSNKGLLSWMNDLQKNNSKWVGMSLYLGLGNLGLMVGGMATANPIMMGVAGIDMIRKILYHSVYRNRMGTGAINTVYDIQAETDRTGFFRLSSSVLNSFMESFANASNRNTSQTGISTLQNILKGSQHARTTLVDVLDTDISRGPSTKNVRKKGIQGSLTTARLSSSQELMNYHLSKYNKASELKQAIERYNRMLESGNYDGLPGIKEIINQQLNKYKKLELKEIGGHIDEKGNKVPVKIGVYDSKYGININKIDGLENYDYGTLFTNIAGIWGSLGGFFQRQEAHSAGTVFIKAGNMFERLHQAKDNKGVTMNAAFRAELEKQFLYKTIGNYERAGGTRTSFGRVLTMFGNYGHENFLNQTFYRKKRADLYKAIYDTMSEDKEFINYLGKAGLSVGAFYLPKNNIVSAVALSSSFKILQFLTTLGAAAMFDDETEELTDKTFNKIGSNFTRGVGFLVGDIVQPIKIFPAMLTMMDQATTVFKKPEMDMRKQTKQTNTIKYAPWDYTGAMGMGYGQSAIFNATFTNGLMIAKTAWDRTYSKRASDKDKKEFFPQFVMNNTALLNFIYGPASLTTQAQKGFLEEYMKGDKKSKHISK